MPWQDQLKGNSLPWLLEKGSTGVSYLAKRDLLGMPSDGPELVLARRVAHKKGPIATILDKMDEGGFWAAPGAGYNPKYRSTVWSIISLAQLGGSVEEDGRIRTACEYLLDNALTPTGQFSATGAPSGTIDCLQGNLCWALVELGYDDPRLQTAFEWMARSVTGEGIAPAQDRRARVRYYAGKCGPNFACGANNKLPCAWGAVKVMMALTKWPDKRRTPMIKRAIKAGVDLLLGTDPAAAEYPTGWSKKPSQDWWKFGFPVFYVTDLLQNVQVLVDLGYGNDPRLTKALGIIRGKQDSNGRWSLEYDYSGKTWVDWGPKKEPNKWVTLRALKVLKVIA